MKTNCILVIAFTALAITSTGCGVTSEDMLGAGMQKGFLHGILHGFLAPLKFLLAFIMEDMHMYATSNNGQWYDAGFLLGIGGFSGGIFKSRRKD
ncbi:MAG: hypothetical protein KTR24_16075 [Saprospiraceae bacterium]|nr:hypothetical protein [Saprospiraceae bacterium]